MKFNLKKKKLEKYPGPGTYEAPSEFGHYTVPKGN